MQIDSSTSHSQPCGRLNPALLIAAAINREGNIDLCMVENGSAVPRAGIEFCLGEDGEIYQRRYWTVEGEDGVADVCQGPAEPLDMIDLAMGLNHAFGPHAPVLFHLRPGTPGGRPRLAFPGPVSDRARLKILHDAFTIQLIAYEEHLI